MEPVKELDGETLTTGELYALQKDTVRTFLMSSWLTLLLLFLSHSPPASPSTPHPPPLLFHRQLPSPTEAPNGLYRQARIGLGAEAERAVAASRQIIENIVASGEVRENDGDSRGEERLEKVEERAEDIAEESAERRAETSAERRAEERAEQRVERKYARAGGGAEEKAVERAEERAY
jgi:hypothetical protein